MTLGLQGETVVDNEKPVLIHDAYLPASQRLLETLFTLSSVPGMYC